MRMAGLIAALVGSLVLAACNGDDDPNTTTIAIVGPVTGQYASFGQQMKNGGEMAVADINAAGGVLGKKLKLDVGDDACDPKQAVAVANQMAGDNVALVAGHYCSGSSIPARPGLRREQSGADLARLHQSGLHRQPRRTQHLSRLRPRRPARRASPAIISPSISPIRTSPSSTTRRLTAKAWPRRSRRRSTPPASRKC